MKILQSIFTTLLLLGLFNSLSAGTIVTVTINGEVEFNQISPSPLGNFNPGDDVTTTFTLDSDLFVDSGSFPTRGYEINQMSFTFSNGAETLTLQNPFPGGQTPYFSLRDNDPAVDGFFTSTSTDFPIGIPLEQLGIFDQFIHNFSVTYTGDVLSSLDILDALGTYDFTNLTVFNFTIDDGPFNAMGLVFGNMTIEAESDEQCTVVGFDVGNDDDFTGNAFFEAAGGNPDGNAHHLGPFFFNDLRTGGDMEPANPAFLGDFSSNSEVTLSFDIKVDGLTDFIGNPIARPIGIRLVNRDIIGPSGPAGVYFDLGAISSSFQPDWTNLSVTFDPSSATLPPDVIGFGDEDPMTFEPILPAGVTFADILANVDEFAITGATPGFFFTTANYDIRIDNISLCLPGTASTGACVFTDGSCVEGLTEGDCFGSGGSYQGDDTTCPSPPSPCTISCPNDITLFLDPGECGDYVTYDIHACPGTEILVTGPASGSFISYTDEVETVTVEVTDLATGESLPGCSFTIQAIEYQDPVTSIACNDDVQISLDGECEAYVTPDMVLEGGPYGCYDDFLVEVEGGNPVLEEGSYGVTVTDENGNMCWGTIHVEDKLPPYVADCPCDVENGGVNTTTIFSDDFDSYMSGMDLQGVNGWSGWQNDGTFSAPSTSDQSLSSPNSVEIEDLADLVQEFSVDEGQAVFTAWQYVPGNFSGQSYFILLNTYDPNQSVFTYNWTVQLRIDSGSGLIVNEGISGGSAALVFDEWIEIRVEIDLDNDTHSVYYDGNLLYSGQWSEELTGGGATSIAALDLFANNASEVYYDDISLVQTAPCEISCVGALHLYNNTELTGDLGWNPDIQDNCDNYSTSYYDEADFNGTCGNSTITRTWVVSHTVHGEEVSEVLCVQRFTIVPSTLDEVQLPPQTVVLPCGAGSSPEEIASYVDNYGYEPLEIVPTLNFQGQPTGINPYDCGVMLDPAFTPNNDGFSIAYPYVIGDCGEYIPINPSVCNIGATYSDQEIPECGGGIKVIRLWQVLDWCNPQNGATPYTQIIKILDKEPPHIDISVLDFDITVSTDPWGCEKQVQLPIPEHLYDDCDDYVTYRVEIPGITNDPFNLPFSETKLPGPHYFPADMIDGDAVNGYVIVNAPKGVHVVTYIAEDGCGNIATDQITLNVVDETPPVAIAKEFIVVSLTSGSTDEDGIAKLYVESVDNGSHDGCTDDLYMEIRRAESNSCWNNTFSNRASFFPYNFQDPDGGQYVKFCCDDIDPDLGYGLVDVILRVWDDGDCDGIPGEIGQDNYNETWAQVRVEDKLAPTIQCPPDVTIDCDEDYLDMTLTGSATAYTTCGPVTPEFDDNVVLDACGVGSVTRTWSVVSGNQIASCIQTIIVSNVDPFDGRPAPVGDIYWPAASLTFECTPSDMGEPTWNHVACSLVASSVDTQEFEFEDGACRKIINNWTVIDWCQYDGDGSGEWTFEQIVKIEDSVKPTIESCDPDTLWATTDCLAQDVVFTNTATDAGDCPSDWLKWDICVDVNYDWSCDYIWTSNNGTGEGEASYSPFDNIYFVSPTGSDGDGGYTSVSIPTSSSSDPELDLPIGDHRIVWTVHDGCGNVTTCEQIWTVEDKKAPTPYCISNLVTAVMDHSGTVTIWASDFNLASEDNCTAQEDLIFAFSEDPEDQSRTFTCSDGLGFNFLQMYVHDEAGNYDYCAVSLSVQDNGVCSGLLNVEGRLMNEYGEGVENVEVKLMKNENVMDTYMSNAEGHYAFEDMPQDPEYIISPYRNDFPLNGVSTLDLVLIQKHILSLQLLDSPYKVIAADANNNGSVSAIDLLDLRKLILGVIDELPNNLSWRFVHMGDEFENPMNPFPFTEIISPYDQSGVFDFVGVKIGDVDGNAVPNSFSDQTAEIRSQKLLQWQLNPDDRQELQFLAKDFTNVSGMQFTLDLGTSASSLAIEAGVLEVTRDNIGLRYSNSGLMSFSWSQSNPLNIPNGEILFTLRLNSELTTELSINDAITKAEIYTEEGEQILTQNLSLEEIQQVVDTQVDELRLMQNIPNPFRESTEISFYLAENTDQLRLQIFDVKGALVKEIVQEMPSGIHSITINKSDLPSSGVYSYKISTENQSLTKRMIHIH